MMNSTNELDNAALSIMKEVVIRALWFPSLVFIAHVLFSLVFGIYKKLPGLDMLTHSLGGIAIAFCFSETLTILCRRGVLGGIDRTVRSVLIFALTATAAVFWEFAEYTFDSYFGTKIQVDLQDTMSDIAFGIFGGLLFLILWRSQRKD